MNPRLWPSSPVPSCPISHSSRTPLSLPPQGLTTQRAFVFPLKAPSVVLFFMEKQGEFITLCSCLGDHCHSSDIKVRHHGSAHLRLAPPIFSYNQEMGNFLHFVKPSQRASATGLPFTNFSWNTKMEWGPPLWLQGLLGVPAFLWSLSNTYPASWNDNIFCLYNTFLWGPGLGWARVGGRLKPYTDVAPCILQILKE